MGEENKEKEKEGNEGKETVIPPEWTNIPIQDYIDKGFNPYMRTTKGRRYITLKKSRREISLGPYTDEKWQLLISMYPKGRLPSFLTIGGAQGQNENMDLGGAQGKSEKAEEHIMLKTIEGPVTRTHGYLEEFKNLIRYQVSRSRELTEFFTDFGLACGLAALGKSGLTVEEFRKVVGNEGRLKDALMSAAETTFKALEYYQTDLVKKVEEERDEARAAYSYVAAQLKELMDNLDPKFRLERMINNYLLSGNVDPDVLTSLIDKWLSMEVAQVRKGLIA